MGLLMVDIMMLTTSIEVDTHGIEDIIKGPGEGITTVNLGGEVEAIGDEAGREGGESTGEEGISSRSGGSSSNSGGSGGSSSSNNSSSSRSLLLLLPFPPNSPHS